MSAQLSLPDTTLAHGQNVVSLPKGAGGVPLRSIRAREPYTPVGGCLQGSGTRSAPLRFFQLSPGRPKVALPAGVPDMCLSFKYGVLDVCYRYCPNMNIKNREIRELAALVFDMYGVGALRYAFDTCAHLLRAGDRDEAFHWFEIGEAIVLLEGASRWPQAMSNHKRSWTLH